MHFFDTKEERAHFVASQPDFKIEGAEEAVRKVVLGRAVKGEHEKPQYSEGKKPVDLARNAHLKEPTYREKDVETFEAKRSHTHALYIRIGVFFAKTNSDLQKGI
ncbi:hypothetical protein HYQ46_002770 [Verticillium longisporum]|nr:hypothetical protein HYQ46_002770 [Verticillium longisporum]